MKKLLYSKSNPALPLEHLKPRIHRMSVFLPNI